LSRRRTVDEADIPAGDPRPGEVWWCGGEALGFGDGGKVRPVLVIGAFGGQVDVVPLTTRKPDGAAEAVHHRAGLSWMTDARRSVSPIELVSSLGPWAGYGEWRRKGGR